MKILKAILYIILAIGLIYLFGEAISVLLSIGVALVLIVWTFSGKR